VTTDDVIDDLAGVVELAAEVTVPGFGWSRGGRI
jgi:hypothetical protein